MLMLYAAGLLLGALLGLVLWLYEKATRGKRRRWLRRRGLGFLT
jgi:hypothetical protein